MNFEMKESFLSHREFIFFHKIYNNHQFMLDIFLENDKYHFTHFVAIESDAQFIGLFEQFCVISLYGPIYCCCNRMKFQFV